MRQPGIHPAADRDQRESQRQQQPRIDPAQQQLAVLPWRNPTMLGAAFSFIMLGFGGAST
jgi:hypothetical protein